MIQIIKMRVLLLLLVLFSVIKGDIGEPNHKVPLFLSLLTPAGGQIYNGRYVKAAVYIALEGGLIYGAIKQDQRMEDAKDDLAYYKSIDNTAKIAEYEFYVDRYKNDRNNFIWMSVGAVLLSAGDAYVDSHFKTFKRDVFSKGDEITLSAMYNKLSLTYNW